ncbi:MAG: PHP domain-containing protein [Actinomycetes bacterium]
MPADDHVHSEWSWDTAVGSMTATCARAIELGLPSVAFTEHADFEPLHVPDGVHLPDEWQHLIADGVLTPPPLDVLRYLACVQECRERFPGLRILSGVELSEPHWHRESTDGLLGVGRFDRILASVHSGVVYDGSARTEIGVLFTQQSPANIVRDYLAELLRMVEGYPDFQVLAHIDYPVRYWPENGPSFDPSDFEAEYRAVLVALAAAGKVLEVNTRVPLHIEVVRWWREEGGESITFASDAHRPEDLARGFASAVDVAEAAGFRPGRDPWDLWHRA